MDQEELDALITGSPESLNLTDEEHLEQVKIAADSLFALYPGQESLEQLEAQLAARKDQIPLFLHLAVKLAKSKRIIASIDHRHHISVIFAVYKERIRIQTSEVHPLGENFLLRKIAQLEWLFDPFPNFSWDLTLVDDGDPENTGVIAEQIIASQRLQDSVKVLYLEEAIRRNLPVTRPLTSADQSQKGGSITYGMWAAAQKDHPGQIIVYTDADLSTHLGQTGLLVDGLAHQGMDAAIGSRREDLSIVVKKGVRNTRGKLFIYLWKRLIPNLNYIVDTQCGFKAFTADTARAVVDDLIEKKFAFDIELLLKTELRRPGSIRKVPIAWIDSEAASTTTDLEPYLSMLQGIVAIYRKYLPKNPEAESFARFIDSLDDARWRRLVANIPSEITSRDPADFGNYNPVSADDLQGALEA